MGLFSFFRRKKKEKVSQRVDVAPTEVVQEQAHSIDECLTDIAEEAIATNDSVFPEHTPNECEQATEPGECVQLSDNTESKPTAVTEPAAVNEEIAAESNQKRKRAPTKKKKSLEEAENAPETEAAPQSDECREEATEVETASEDTTCPAPEKTTGRFEIKRAKDGRYVFNLYASNHIIVATSQVYSSSQSALIGINSVIANADKAPVEDRTLKVFETYGFPKWEIYLDKAGEYRFRLYASNGSCICHSQGYTTKTNCKKGIDSIIRSSRNAEIDKSYLKKEDK